MSGINTKEFLRSTVKSFKSEIFLFLTKKGKCRTRGVLVLSMIFYRNRSKLPTSLLRKTLVRGINDLVVP